MMIAMVKVIFWAGWLILLLVILAIRISVGILRLIVKGVCCLIASKKDKAKGYEVRYYG